MPSNQTASKSNSTANATANTGVTGTDFAIRGGTFVLESPDRPGEFVFEETSVAVKDGRIVSIGSRAHEGAAEVFDAKGLHVLPGVIDSQVHFREPGLTHKEDLESGTRGAVLGGVTTVFEMPNTKPGTTTPELYQAKLDLAKGRVWCDISFFAGAASDNYQLLFEMESHPNCCAIKIFMGSSTGSLLVEDDEHLLQVLQSGRRRVAIHAEDEFRLRERRHLVEGSGDVHLHPVWRDEITALNATKRILALARKAARPVHVLHITTAEEMELLKASKDIATVETTPQHLTLAAPECYDRLGTLAQMNPPIREARHREALWKAVNDGTVTVLGSDHAPHTREEKSKRYPDTPSGMTGVQTILPIMLDHVNQRRLTLARMVELLCRGPARLYNSVGKGAIRVGNDADFTIVDLKMKREITDSWIASKVGWTPFNGVTVQGWPKATIVRGNVVMREDQLLARQIGELVKFDVSEDLAFNLRADKR